MNIRIILILLLLIFFVPFVNAQADGTTDTIVAEDESFVPLPDEDTAVSDSTDDTSVVVESVGPDSTAADETDDKWLIDTTTATHDDASSDSPKKKNDDKPQKKRDNRQFVVMTDKSIFISTLSPLNKVGISLIAPGLTFTLTGAVLFFYDYFGYKVVLSNTTSYAEYQAAYQIDMALMACGVTALTLGLLLVSASVPMILIKFKKKKVTFSVEPGLHTNMYFTYYL